MALDTDAPVQLFAGRNGAGKSSIRDAVVLALTGDLGRVSLKKDAAQLISDGATGPAVCVVTADDAVHGVSISPAGKLTSSRKLAPDQVLLYVLNAQRFAALPASDRRGFLYGLMGLSLDIADVGMRLADRECDPTKAQRIAVMLRAGFPAAAEEARLSATQAKGAWRAVTGETYGAVKAATWRAPTAQFDNAALAAAQQKLAQIDGAIAAAQQQVGAHDEAERALSAARNKLAGLRDTAAELVRRQVKLQHDEAALKQQQDALDAATAKAGNAPRVGLVHDLAELLSAVVLARGYGDGGDLMARAEDVLTAYETAHGKIGAAHGDSEAQSRLPALTAALNLMASAVRNSMRYLKASEAAAAEIVVLEAQIATGAGTSASAPADAARKVLADLQLERRAVADSVDRQRAAKTAVESAAQKTTDAARHHADAAAWEKIAEALGPDGIPGEILAATLGPINARLAQSAVDAQWPAVVIGADMAITFGGRAYGLVSESEKYRADAMLAEAVAHISGVRLLVLDRFDVLDLQGRADLIAWLDLLADNQEIDTALIFGTLKSRPTGLMPETCAAHWIDGGKCFDPAVTAQAQASAEAA